MFWRKKTKPVPETSAMANEPSGAERRRSPRIPTAILTCELGPVLDVSRHGIRISIARVPPIGVGSEFALTLDSPRDAVEVKARIIRIKHVGYGRYELACEFVDVQANGDAIENLATTGSSKSSLLFDESRKERLVAALRLPDYYHTLGLTMKATDEQIQAAYREKARQYHPDLNKAPEATRIFAQINEAHDVLHDPKRRAEYDVLYALRAVA